MSHANQTATLTQLTLRALLTVVFLATSLSWFMVLSGGSLGLPVVLSIVAMILLLIGSKYD